MARAPRTWAINRRGKNSVHNLKYGPRTWLVRGIYKERLSLPSDHIFENVSKPSWTELFAVFVVSL